MQAKPVAKVLAVPLFLPAGLKPDEVAKINSKDQAGGTLTPFLVGNSLKDSQVAYGLLGARGER